MQMSSPEMGAVIETGISSGMFVTSVTVASHPETLISEGSNFSLSLRYLLQTFSEIGIPIPVTLGVLAAVGTVGIIHGAMRIGNSRGLLR